MFDVKSLAKLLSVSEKTVYRWISKKEIPVYKVGESYRFNQAEILEWTSRKKIKVSDNIFEEKRAVELPHPILHECLAKGGIYYHISGSTRKEVLDSVVNVINLPEDVDRGFIADALIARENLGTTAIGNGMAIPHVRNPIIFHLQNPLVGLCFLDEPIDFKAPDGRLVDTLFTIITSNIHDHLYILSRLTYTLSIPELRKEIVSTRNRQSIINTFINAIPPRAGSDLESNL
ncbi:MAG: PTS sugar transporter subunit IIA [Spirochaetales bacterium]|nr:PTS sugar transporter subunit IIA [Spirochaetales bacterium]